MALRTPDARADATIDKEGKKGTDDPPRQTPSRAHPKQPGEDNTFKGFRLISEQGSRTALDPKRDVRLTGSDVFQDLWKW